MCIMRNRKFGKVMQSCVSSVSQQARILSRGGACGCCDFDDPVTGEGDDATANTGECPTGTCDSPDHVCDLEDGSGEGVYMCRRKGGSGKTMTQVCATCYRI